MNAGIFRERLAYGQTINNIITVIIYRSMVLRHLASSLNCRREEGVLQKNHLRIQRSAGHVKPLAVGNAPQSSYNIVPK